MNTHCSTVTIARKLASDIERDRVVVLHGVNNLILAKRAFEHLVASAGLTIIFDPDSDAELRDYLIVTGGRAIKGAAAGAAVGLLLGLIFGEAKVLAGLGGVIGGICGAANGVQEVDAGWRVRATWEGATPVVSISAR